MPCSTDGAGDGDGDGLTPAAQAATRRRKGLMSGGGSGKRVSERDRHRAQLDQCLRSNHVSSAAARGRLLSVNTAAAVKEALTSVISDALVQAHEALRALEARARAAVVRSLDAWR